MIKATLEEQGYLSSKDAGAILGYTHDYISRLCRHGKMVGMQKGREWYVKKDELEAFKKRHEVELQEKKVELSKKFSRIRLEAEAKKRKAREAVSTPAAAQVVHSQEVQKELGSSKQSLKFVMPKQFVAIAVLAVLLVLPTFFKAQPVNTPSRTAKATTTTNTPPPIVTYIEEGIARTIEEQSTIVPQVAAVFSFAPYLADGYWTFFTTIAQLPGHVYDDLTMIGNGYLTLYLTQGELIYRSGYSMHTMGASVLRGYELVGESLVVGTYGILEVYSDWFNIGSTAESGKKKLSEFAFEVNGGLGYAQDSVSSTLFQKLTGQVQKTKNTFIDNLGENIYAMYFTTSSLTKNISANASSLFDFKILENKSEIRTIRVENSD